jgi:hypothetical protein
MASTQQPTDIMDVLTDLSLPYVAADTMQCVFGMVPHPWHDGLYCLLESLADAISLGTLQIFTFVNAGVIVLRMRPPEIDEEELMDSSYVELEASPLVQDAQAAKVA